MGYAGCIIALATFATILLLPPLAWHSKTRNTPAIILIAWLLIMDVKSIVDAAVWSGSDSSKWWSGGGWCDIMVKLQIGANVGISCAVANIAFNLHQIIKADTVLLDVGSWKKLIVDLGFCIVTPVFVMVSTYLVQISRYSLFSYNGCQSFLSPTWVTLITYTLWMFLWSLMGFIYALLLLQVFYMKRKDVRDILHCTNSGLNFSRFSRLLIFCLSIILVMFPFSLYSFVIDLQNVSWSYNWKELHNAKNWNSIPRISSKAPMYSTWLYILMSMMVFLIFGLGADAMALYAKFARSVGLGPVLHKFDSYFNSESENRVNRLTGQFMKQHGYSDYYSGTVSDSSGSHGYSDGKTATTSSPSNFTIDYMLPQDIKRQERRRRHGVTVAEMMQGHHSLSFNDMLEVSKEDLDYSTPIDMSPFADVLTSDSGEKKSTGDCGMQSLHSDTTRADNSNSDGSVLASPVRLNR